MSFFIVDDRFSGHEKVARLLECDRPDRDMTRFVALALWTLAGSECSRRRNGGRVTLHLAKNLLGVSGKQAAAAANLLVKAELWIREDDGQYRFHQWEKWQRPRDRKSPESVPVDDSKQPTSRQDLANVSPTSRQDLANVSPTELNDSDGFTPPSSSSSSPTSCSPPPPSSGASESEEAAEATDYELESAETRARLDHACRPLEPGEVPQPLDVDELASPADLRFPIPRPAQDSTRAALRPSDVLRTFAENIADSRVRCGLPMMQPFIADMAGQRRKREAEFIVRTCLERAPQDPAEFFVAQLDGLLVVLESRSYTDQHGKPIADTWSYFANNFGSWGMRHAS